VHLQAIRSILKHIALGDHLAFIVS
jgi:hypothetical protein